MWIWIHDTIFWTSHRVLLGLRAVTYAGLVLAAITLLAVFVASL